MTMTEPGFPVRITRGVPVVTAPEEIDITNASQLRAALLHAAARPGPALVVDMTRTRFCDSAGLLKHNHRPKPAYSAFRRFTQ